MKLAVLHYHLIRGGVTRVIENQLRALDAVLPAAETWPVAILYGGRRDGWPDALPERLRRIRLEMSALPALDYGTAQAGREPTAEALGSRIGELLGQRGFAPHETVLHVHNHALGKNAALPGAVRMLAARGYAMVLQPHDFAEDFRPANFRRLAERLSPRDPDHWHSWLYPQAPHVHYAALNGRDHAILRATGVETERLYLLPNPVPRRTHLPAKEAVRAKLAERFGVAPGDRLILYPVRGIRRKNLGEALLYAALAPPGTVVGLTLAPINPAEREIYDRWKQFALALRLPVRFELGGPGAMSFAENLAAADRILTTSVAEGFGMVFLESWLAGRPLSGRDLPEITADFVRAGLRLDALCPRLDVPLDWVGAEAFGRAVSAAYRATLAAFGRRRCAGPADVIAAKTSGGRVDFGDLDEPLQQQVIRRVCRDEANRRRLLDANPALHRSLGPSPADNAERIRHNAEAIDRHFSLAPSGRRLLELYDRVAAAPRSCQPGPLRQAPAILDAFLDLKRFRLIRS